MVNCALDLVISVNFLYLFSPWHLPSERRLLLVFCSPPSFTANQPSALRLLLELLSVFQGVGVLGWLVVGEGLPTVRVLPVQRCQKHCSSFNLWLTPGDMGNTCCTCSSSTNTFNMLTRDRQTTSNSTNTPWSCAQKLKRDSKISLYKTYKLPQTDRNFYTIHKYILSHWSVNKWINLIIILCTQHICAPEDIGVLYVILCTQIFIFRAQNGNLCIPV